MNYLEHFGLQSEPFLNVPSFRVFYRSAGHGKALLRLMTVAERGSGILVLTGPRGVGKSVLMRRLLDGVSPEIHSVAFLPLVEAVPDESLLLSISQQLRVDLAATFESLDAACAGLLRKGMRPLILLDDAHVLPAERLAKFAQLTNAAVFLAGQSGAAYPPGEVVALDPLNADGTDAYVRTRLKIAGCLQDPFDGKARKAVYDLSGGNPARINVLCEQTLIAAAAAGIDRIDHSFVIAAGLTLGFCDPEGRPLQKVKAKPSDQQAATDGALSVPSQVAAAAKMSAAAVAVTRPSEVEEAHDELDDLVGSMAEEPSSTTVNESAGDDIDDMLRSLEAEEQSTEKTTPELTPEDNLDALLGQLEAEEDSSPSAAEAESTNDIDELLSDVNDPASSQPSVVETAQPVRRDAETDIADSDIDSMLGELDSEIELKERGGDRGINTGDEDLDALLSGLDEGPDSGAGGAFESAAGKADEEDLDALLSGLDNEAASSPAAATPASGDDDLESLLDSLDVETTKPPAKQTSRAAPDVPKALAGSSVPKATPTSVAATPDDLERELDSLLEGLED